MIYRAFYDSPIGTILLESDGEKLTSLRFLEGDGAAVAPARAEKVAQSVFKHAFSWLDRYFNGEAPAVDVPLKAQGTPFQREVWAILNTIPYGKTLSYGEIAAMIGKNRVEKTGLLSRAVGAAVGRNPISLLIPCHRVIGSDGSLRGYAGGIERKAYLLSLEGALKR